MHRFFMIYRGLAALTGLSVVAALATPAQARAGDLDTGFGNAGKVTTDYAGAFDEGRGLVLQSDGRIVVAGEAQNPTTGRDFSVTRYRTDGTLDASFGTGGKVSTDFGADFDIAFDTAVQPDGKVVAAGISGTGADPASFDVAVARYRPDGSLDPSFGAGGRVTTDFAGDDDEAYAVGVQTDGRIVVAGFATTGAGLDFALVRYRADGSLDPSFGAGGRVTTDFAGGDDNAFGLAIQSDGRIVVAGVAVNARTDGDFALVRYRADGSLDPSFGAGGRVTTDFAGGYDEADGLSIQGDGRIVVSGGRDLVEDTSGAFALARYQANGSLDTSFGAYGKVTTEFTGGLDQAYAVTVQPDGRIVAAGAAAFVLNVSGDFALARYRANGSLDPAFGTGGTVVTDVAGTFDNAFDVAIQADGKIVATGEANASPDDRDIALVRYLKN